MKIQLNRFLFVSILALSLFVSKNAFAYTPKAPNIRGVVLNPKLSDYKTMNLDKIKQKIIIVNFWATWCPPCRAEIPMLNNFYKTHYKKVAVVGVNVNVTENGVRNFLRQFDGGISYPVVHANMLDIENYGGLSEVPQSFFILNHKIVFHWTGELTKRFLRAIVQKMSHYDNK